MKDPFPERGLAHRPATLRAQAGSCTEPPSATPRGLSERAQIADLRSPHRETVNLRGTTRRPGGELGRAEQAQRQHGHPHATFPGYESYEQHAAITEVTGDGRTQPPTGPSISP